MDRTTEIAPAGAWPTPERRDSVTLPHHDRFRRRIRLTGDNGLDFLLDLPEARVLHHGEGLKLVGGGYVEVIAAREPLIEITAGPHVSIARLAWHLGNRHLPAEIQAERILIRDDHVIVEMLKGLGASVRAVEAPFEPEGGAYGQHNHDPKHPFGHGSKYHQHADGSWHSHD
jgi:urease accessory protein